MQRTRDWRRNEFVKHRKRDLRLMNAFSQPICTETREENLIKNYEAIRKGGWKRSYMCRYWHGEMILWGRRARDYRIKHKGPQPLDKELEAWYD